MYNPYQASAPHAFWKSAVSNGLNYTGIFTPKFKLDRNTIFGTAGSCFAQHIGRNLASSGCNLYDAEPTPRHLTSDQAKRFGYGLYSARYGNIYTARQFLQLLEEVEANEKADLIYWAFGDNWLDALRPSVEPDGLSSLFELEEHRSFHLKAISKMLREIDVFIFTLGMTEGWQDKASGRILPICPGVIAGEYSEETTKFVNFTYNCVMDDLQKIHDILLSINPNIHLILTVSPVPLAATAGGGHVLTATCHSKAILRAAAGSFSDLYSNVDYFPSYDIVASTTAEGSNFMPNLREVRSDVVSKVVSIFIEAYGLGTSVETGTGNLNNANLCRNSLREGHIDCTQTSKSDVICEEALLAGFAN
jgi:hypothetical protein